MIRRSLAGLLAALLAVPSFGAPVEAVRSNIISAPAFTAAAPISPPLSATTAPSPLIVAPLLSAAAAAAPAAAYVPAPVPEAVPAVPEARAPPRSAQGVSSRVADTVRAWNVPVEQLLADRDVLLVGEDHASLTVVDTLARELPRLKKAGVTAVGIEGLKRHDQDAVDDYISRRTDIFPHAALNFSPARSDAFETLLTAARDHGVRVVALGLPLNEWAAQTARLAAKNMGEPAEIFGTDFKSQVDRAENDYEYGFNEAVAEVLFTRRNEIMAKYMAQALGEKGKGVILAGQAHVPGVDEVPFSRFRVRGDYGDLARELALFALRAYSLTFTGGLFNSVAASRDARDVRPEAHKVAAAASPDGAPVFVPLGPDAGLWHAGGRISPVRAR